MSEPQGSESEPAAAETREAMSDDQVVADIKASVEEAARLRTGDPQVDDVIDDVAAIGDRPLSEQPGGFDDAHERLRRVLDSPSEESSSDDSPA